MAFKMSPVGKNKCSYSPMQKKGLINPSPVKVATSSTGSSSTSTVTKPAAGGVGIRTIVGANDPITQSNDFDRRTQDFNKTPEGKRLSDSVNAMSGAINSGDFKDGSNYFFKNSAGETTYFTEDDYKNASGAYVKAKNDSVGQKSLEERGASGGNKSSYMDSSVLRDVVSINKGGKNIEVANLKENKDFADYPKFGDDTYYQGIANEQASKKADEQVYVKKQTDAVKNMRSIGELQKQLRANPELSAQYKNVASMKSSEARKKQFTKLLDLQRQANKSQSTEVTNQSTS
mgnify:FL=1|jgi:hypothetical protein|tara:strand:+ start:3193 stop:4059 length:867 start_codon:yes stop_codon:yes gene_type:complete